MLERRELLNASAFLQGAVTDTGNNPLAGATVTLYPHGSSTPLASVVTGSSGHYLFETTGTAATGVAIVPTLTTGAEYDLVETAPLNYTNSSTQGFTQVSTLVGSTSNSFDVSIPASATAEVDVTNTYGPTGFYNNWDVVTWQVGSGTYNPITNQYANYTTDTNAPSTFEQFPATVNGNSFLTLCSNDDQNLAGPASNVFTVDPTSNFNPPSTYGARIAYLYDKYGTSLEGTSQPLSAVDSVGLQMAIDVLLLDAGGSLDTGTFTQNDFNSATTTLTTQTFINPERYPGFSSTNPTNPANPSNNFYTTATFGQEEAQAVSFINESFNQAGQAWYLPVDTNSAITKGDQSLIGTDNFDFTDTAKAQPTITTTPSPSSVALGTSMVTLTDSAVLSGGNSPMGTITFTLVAPGGGTVDTETVSVNGNGTYTTPIGYTLPTNSKVTGTYQWNATFTDADGNNFNASDINDKAEQVPVSPAGPKITTTPSPTSATQGASVTLKDSAVLSGGYSPSGSITFTLYSPSNTLLDTETVTVNGNGTYTTPTGYVLPANAATGTYQWDAVYMSGNGNNINASDVNDTAEQVTVSGGTPQLTITKVPDQATVTAGTTIGFTVTIGNPGTAAATGLMLSDQLPTGGNEFFNWTIDTTKSNPSDFTITGSPGSESLALSPAFISGGDSLAAGQSISVHITTPTTVGDVSGGAVGLQSGVSSSTYLGAAGNYGVLYMVDSGTHNLSITNVTLGANVGVGSGVGGNGVGNVTFSGPGIVTGRLDFAPGQTNSFSNNNSSNVGPASVNTNVAAVASAISTVTSLNSAVGALSGTSIAINGTQTINESAGTFHTVNGVTYSVFTVTSYNENDGKVFTINGDGSGDPVVLNFGPNSGNINLGGDVALTGNGLNDDKVIWNFTSSNQNLQLNNNASSFYTMAFHGIILAPHDGIHLVNANLSGRIFGGDNQDMQLVSGLTLHAPIMNTATVASGNLSASSSATITITGPFKPSAHFNADISNAGLAYTADQVRSAYGVNNLSLDGTGQTIAIVDAYDDPSIVTSLDSFDQQMSKTSGGLTLYSQYGAASSFLTVLGQDGTTTDLPPTDTTGGWETEEALDVEWVHAMAPGARIVLVEANSDSLGNLMSAVKTAAGLPGVSVVSMSWGFAEGQAVLAADEAQYDSYLTTPAGHQGVTFVASTGDYGAADPEYPAFSPNVVAVGGTSLYLNSDNSYKSETGWGYFSNGLGVAIGGGGGVSLYETEPAFQQGAQSTGYRTTPDVSMIADPATGVWLADTYNLDSSNPWEIAGGTSLSAPSWAGLIALADQARVAAGGQTLGSAGSTETQQALYSLPVTDFHAVTTGNNGYSAGPGYNLVGGLGTPIANLLVPDLAAYAGSTAVPAGRIALSSAEATLSNGFFGTTALTVADVELASALGDVHHLSSNAAANSVPQASTGSSVDATLRGASPLSLAGAPNTTAASEADMADLLASNNQSDRLSSGPSGLSSTALRRTSLRASNLDGDALDTLFSASGTDSSPLPTELGDEGLAGLTAIVRSARPTQPVPGDAGATASKEAATNDRDSTWSPRASSPSRVSSVGWTSGSTGSTGATPAVAAESILGEKDELIEAVDAATEKLAEAVARAYESLVDAVFGLVG